MSKDKRFDVDSRGSFDHGSLKSSDGSRGERFAAPGNAPADTDKKGKKRPDIIVIVAALVLMGSIIVLASHFIGVWEAKRNAEKLAEIYDSNREYKVIHAPDPIPGSGEASDVTSVPAIPDQTEPGDESSAPVTETVREPLVLTASASEFLAINPDTVGYVTIPDIIKEVVVQADDNEYYLDHNFYGQKRQCGTCFADYRNNVNDYPDLMSDNIILYSHNQKDGSMFGNMDYYRWDLTYWQKNPFIYFSNNYGESTYVIISSFVTNALPEHDNGNVFDYWNYIDFNEEYTYDGFISEITERSTIITGVDVNSEDKFLTLQTCSTEWDESRHIIVARKLRENEAETDIDISKLQINPNPKWPAIYYKYHGGSYDPNG